MDFRNAEKQTVVITGIGVIAPTGIGVNCLLHAIREGISSASPLTDAAFNNYPVKSVCKIDQFNPTDFLSYKDARHMTKCSQFGVSAAKLAVQDAKLDLSQIDPSKIEIYEGTSIGGMDKIFQDYDVLLAEGYEHVNPHTPIYAFVGATTGEIAITLGVRSRSLTVCSGSASSSDAIGLGFERIRTGEIDVSIVGGAETPIIPQIIASFCRTGVISLGQGDPKKAFKSFTADRNGFGLGEGGVFLILESKNHAQRRGARIYAEMAGFGNSCDAYHMITPHPKGEGILLATERALRSANATLKDVDYINAHGTGTLLNDKYETVAMKKTYGSLAYKIPITSTKPITGHLLGACGALEAVICVLAIQNAMIPPTINFENPDPECDLDFVPNTAREKTINLALSYKYGFGGKNSVLAIRRYKK